MDDKETIVVLKRMLGKSGLGDEERGAISGAVGALSLMVHTSESHLKQLKKKRERTVGRD